MNIFALLFANSQQRCPPGSAAVVLAVAMVVFNIGAASGQALAEGEQFKSSQDFVNSYLGKTPNNEIRTLWLTGELKERAKEVLGHRFNGLRVRYWGEGARTLWILDEVGKELPITMGVVVEQHRVVDIQILEYRESRGGEVRYPFFTKQFKGLTLDSTDSNKLNQHIDGITGATLSVAAVKKIAILALVFHKHTPFGST